MNDLYVIEVPCHRVPGGTPAKRALPITGDTYQKGGRAPTQVGHPEPGPPHRARHGGAAATEDAPGIRAGAAETRAS